MDSVLCVDFQVAGDGRVARLGGYEYPEIGLIEAVSIAKRISRDFGGEISRAHLAEVLGMSERGGRFSVVLGGLRMWRVAEGRSNLRLTPLGARAAAPVSAEESAANTTELARSVNLFNSLNDRMGGAFSDRAALSLVLEELTGAARSEISLRIATLEKIIQELPFGMASDKQPYGASDSTEDRGPKTGFSGVSTGVIRANDAHGRVRLEYSGGLVDLEESVTTIAVTIQLLEERRRIISP
jgi:hypothetical protein